MKKNKIKAVFFDRDGTLIYEKPGHYLGDPKELRLYKTTRPALKELSALGYKFFIISNQSGIGRGYFKEADVKRVHDRLQKLLSPYKMTEIVYCPHAPECECSCRKPNPALGIKLIRKYNIDVSRSFMAGDKKSDIDFGRALGMRTILLKTANGGRQIKKYGALIKADKIAANMRVASAFIRDNDET